MADQTDFALAIRGAEGSKTDEPVSAMDQRMRTALETYREKMYKSNVQFIHDRIKDIEALNLPDEESKLALMGRFWFHMDEWYREEPYYPNDDPNDESTIAKVARTNRTNAVRRLEDVKTLPHPRMDGFYPPFLKSDAQRQALIDALERVANEFAETEKNGEQWIRAPEELKSFLKYSSGLKDPNFRYARIADFQIGDVPCGTENQSPEEARETLVEFLRVDRDDNFLDLLVCYIELEAAIYTGHYIRAGVNFYSLYVYCRLYENHLKDPEFPEKGEWDCPIEFINDKDDKNKHEWAWRVVFMSDGHSMADEKITVFNTILDFIEWYGSWLERMDVGEMQVQMFENPNDLFSLYQ